MRKSEGQKLEMKGKLSPMERAYFVISEKETLLSADIGKNSF